jgi:hypothetical protein
MRVQPAAPHYTLEQIRAIGERWLSVSVIQQFIAAYLQAEFERTGKRRRFYQRLLPPLVVLWLMLYQRLQADHSCDAAVSAFVSSGWSQVGWQSSESSSAYCQARQRLPLSVVAHSLTHAAGCLREELGAAALWCGRQVALIDGSTIRLAATNDLHAHYGASHNQHGENHWPIMRILAAFHLYSGGVEAVMEAPYSCGEVSLAVTLLRAAVPGWVWVGDANFGAYRIAQVAHHQQQDLVVRLRTDRVQRWIRHQPMRSGEDRSVSWSGANNQYIEPDLPAPDIAGRLLYVRVERDGFRPMDVYLFTTLTDRLTYSTQAILALYARRWNVELNLRHLKITMAMEELRAKSVDMVRKELLVGLLAYTLMRGVMGLAALQAHLAPLALSFARCTRRILASAQQLASADSPEQLRQYWQLLLQRLAKCKVPTRKKARHEPRYVWGRPRVYPTIKGSREQARIDEAAKWALPNS